MTVTASAILYLNSRRFSLLPAGRCSKITVRAGGAWRHTGHPTSAYYRGCALKWEPYRTVEFDARRVVTLDENGDEIEETACGKG